MRSAGVIGWPVAHSKSPLIHRFWLGKLGLDGDYGRFPVAPERLGEAIRALSALSLAGVNVTVPHKVAVMAHLDRVAPEAQRIGAVNTVVVEHGGTVGYNTDGRGFLEPIAAVVAGEAPGTAVIIGAGGAARAVVDALWHAGYTIVIANRDRERARQVADAVAGVRSVEIATPSLAQLDTMILGGSAMQPVRWSLLVNASSLGMTGGAPFTPNLAGVGPSVIIYDLVYAPLETPLLAAARARRLRTIDGLAMLIGQAAAAFELFFGAPAPREHDAELRALLTA
ncbi:MAG: shikimate dehydrogenase [Sphingomonadaceae bacterium]|nr:shikimate dehydrogenase [Sphingomonadaceae bacterium]